MKLNVTHLDEKADLPNAGRLLALLTALFYGLFTLLPDSNSLVVSWAWVFIWQVGLICPVLWLLGLLWQRQLRWLGNRLDWLVGLLVVGLVVSSGLAEFPMQARWYSWTVFCYLAALYALSSWLPSASRRIGLLVAQGYLNLAFIIVSLTGWTSQTLLPELARLRSLQPYGVPLSFDFSQLELRNWFPIGHQNYVAGYLVLALPLLTALAVLQTGRRRWLWATGVGLGLIDLYTTSSRAGLVAVLVLAIVGTVALLWYSRLPRLWLGIGSAAGLLLLGAIVLTNNRLGGWLINLLSGRISSEVSYRIVTSATGWQMGLSRPFTGVGPGSVPLAYQQYRPLWAGRTAELAYQLHSTPAHLWAELGLWAVVVGVGAIVLLTYLSSRWAMTANPPMPRILIASLLIGLLGYGVVSLTDYQLDNVCISGTIVIFLAVLAAEFRDLRPDNAELDPPAVRRRFSLEARPLALAGVGMLLAAIVWLVPLHRAWLLSSQGFAALNREDFNGFVQRLEQAHNTAPWEPYYAYQIGWNLGDRSLQTRDPQEQQTLVQGAIAWLRRGLQAAPYQEFGHSNLAWLTLGQDPKAAAQAFVRSAQLIPAKRGVFYGLGLSLLAQGKPDWAIDAISLEAVRDPVLLTSPIWRLPQLQSLFGPVVDRVEARYTTLLSAAQNAEPLTTQLHQSRGGVRWWRGNFAEAHRDLDSSGTVLSRLVLDLADGKTIQPQQLAPLIDSVGPQTAGALAIAAWLNPPQRQDFLQRAWIAATRTAAPPEVLQPLVETMTRSTSFDQWLKAAAPSRQLRRERAGFGVLSRHDDGPTPVDFLTIVENVPIAQFFSPLIPSFAYAPDFDRALQVDRDALLQKVSGL